MPPPPLHSTVNAGTLHLDSYSNLVGSLWTLLFFSSFSIHLLFTLSCSGCLCTPLLPLFFQDNSCFSILFFVTFQCLYPRDPPPPLPLYSIAFTSSIPGIVILWSLHSPSENYPFFYLSSNISTSYTAANLWTMRQSCLCCNVTWHKCTFSPFLVSGTIYPCLCLCLCSYYPTPFTPISFLNATTLNSISALSFCFEVGRKQTCYNDLEYTLAQIHLPLQTLVHWPPPPTYEC